MSTRPRDADTPDGERRPSVWSAFTGSLRTETRWRGGYAQALPLLLLALVHPVFWSRLIEDDARFAVFWVAISATLALLGATHVWESIQRQMRRTGHDLRGATGLWRVIANVSVLLPAAAAGTFTEGGGFWWLLALSAFLLVDDFLYLTQSGGDDPSDDEKAPTP